MHNPYKPTFANGLLIFCIVINAVAMLFMPDSPVHLLSKDDNNGARQALIRLRGQECPYINQELEKMKANLQAARAAVDKSVSYTDLFTMSVYLKPFVIEMGLMFFQQFSGINAVIFYLQYIFYKAGSSMDPGLSSFFVTLSQVKSGVLYY